MKIFWFIFFTYLLLDKLNHVIIILNGVQWWWFYDDLMNANTCFTKFVIKLIHLLNTESPNLNSFLLILLYYSHTLKLLYFFFIFFSYILFLIFFHSILEFFLYTFFNTFNFKLNTTIDSKHFIHQALTKQRKCTKYIVKTLQKNPMSKIIFNPSLQMWIYTSYTF